MTNPSCQDQLIDAAKLVAKSVDNVVDSSQMACKDEALLQDLGAAATAVTKALNDLLSHIKGGVGQKVNINLYLLQPALVNL